MSTITKKTNEFGTDWIKVNGRCIEIAHRIENIEKTGNGKWTGTASGEDFEIVGGFESGGAPNEWFVRWSLGYGDNYLPRKSAADCIRAIENV